MTTGEKNITWADIKEFANKLSDSDLSQEVKFWGDNKCGGFCEIVVLGEDYINPSGEAAEPVSAYNDEPETVEGETVVYAAGTILLTVNE